MKKTVTPTLACLFKNKNFIRFFWGKLTGIIAVSLEYIVLVSWLVFFLNQNEKTIAIFSLLYFSPLIFLCPILEKRHVVVMDNVAFHQVCGVRESIEAMGAKLTFLPPYSPDLNPIELMWGKIKNYLRKEAARTLDRFAGSVKKAFMSIKSTDLINWYRHCGYRYL